MIENQKENWELAKRNYEALEENLEKKKVLKLKEEDREMKVRIFPNPQRILSTMAKQIVVLSRKGLVSYAGKTAPQSKHIYHSDIMRYASTPTPFSASLDNNRQGTHSTKHERTF